MYESAAEYYRGTVDDYHDREGYGYIRPDPDESINGLLLFHRTSLRSLTTQLRRGDRVLFSVTGVEQGGSARDVHPESVEEGGLEHRLSGEIRRYVPERGFGFVADPGGQEAFFHITQLVDDNVIPTQGLQITYKLVQTLKGLQAQEIALADPLPETGRSDWLPQAILARDARKYDDAARLYERGLQNQPTVQLVLSYAAMEKNRNRKQAAMRVYEEGIKRFPGNAKLREDAGILAASLRDFRTAGRLLEESLAI
jgi:cold shock CspA family protein